MGDVIDANLDNQASAEGAHGEDASQVDGEQPGDHKQAQEGWAGHNHGYRGAADQQLDVQRGHGLTELCQLKTKGYSEKILRLTEAFLPPRYEPGQDRQMYNQDKARMDEYNRARMPHLKQPDKQILE
jgi:hypothetical protein